MNFHSFFFLLLSILFNAEIMKQKLFDDYRTKVIVSVWIYLRKSVRIKKYEYK